jgi:hypothetical protein
MSSHGGRAGDTLIGNAARNALIGLGGDDALVGLGGDDYLLAGDGDDALYGDQPLLAGPLPDVPLGAALEAGTFAPVDEPFTVQSEDGDDELHGYGGNDLVVGGPGQDYMLADFGNFEPPQPGVPGDDFVDAREPEDGPVVKGEGPGCDEGTDAAALDGDDHPWRCEVTVFSGRSASPPEFPPYPPYGPGPGEPETPLPAIVDVAGEPTSKDGGVLAKLRCNSALRCKGRAALAKGKQALGEREFSIAPRKSARVRVKLTGAGRRYVQRKRRVGARLDVFAAGTPSAGPAWRGSILLLRSRL